MSCDQILELLDAYALGAVEPEEATGVEHHVAECVGCWNELGRAQETAALLTLSVPLKQAPERLGQRIISTAQRETSPIRGGEKQGFFRRLGVGWPALAGTLGVASVAAFAFGISMQEQVNDLEAENSGTDRRVAVFHVHA
jgi:anti-sigma factor RsiW